MGSVNIDAEDSISIKDFEGGNSIQVRVSVTEKEKAEYAKGKTVTVVHEGGKMTGRIVSEPIEISKKKEGEDITLSLIVEKS